MKQPPPEGGNTGDDREMNCCQSVCYAIGCNCCGGDVYDSRLDKVADNEDRACTDVPFCLLLICIFIAQCVIFHHVRVDKEADPSWLIRGRDFRGIECEKGDYFAWPDPFVWGAGICARDCNVTQTEVAFVATGDSEACGYASEPWLDHWCIPTPDTGLSISGLGGTSDTINKAFGDLLTVKWWLLASAGVALVFAGIYSYFLEKCTSCLVYTSMILVLLGGLGLGVVLMQNASVIRDNGYSERASDAMYTLGALLIFFDLVFCIVLCFLIKSINLAIDVIEQAAVAFQQVWRLIFFPIIVFVMLMSYFAFWFIIALYIASVEVSKQYDLPTEASDCGDQTTLAARLSTYVNDGNVYTQYTYYEFDEEFANYMWFHLFCAFWTVQYIIYWSYAVVSGVFAEWYFSKWHDNGETKIMESGSPIFRSMWRITRYHTGTVAFGSLIIAVIRFARAVLLYIESKAIEYENKFMAAILCCIQCILKCLDCCLSKITKDGFVFTSIYGTPFCSSAINAFDMIMKNLINVAALGIVSDYVEFIGKMAICLFTTGFMIFVIDASYEEDEISSYMCVCLALIAISYLVAIVFMHLFDVAIETLFLCYVIDIEANGNPVFSSPAWNEMVDKHKAESADLAKKVMTLRGENGVKNTMIAE